MPRTRYPDLDTVGKNCLRPREGGLESIDPEASRRHWAIAEVLCSIPEGDYQRLRDAVGDFDWFIPHRDQLGSMHPFPVTAPNPPPVGKPKRIPTWITDVQTAKKKKNHNP